ncbi:MAG TPA: hypothetical protein VK891_05690 [Euzebyales bacterium]|nr:hypothetical protein [Euzebyales bacterium]
MRRLLPIVGLAVLLVALAPTAALAKGPVEVSINGPGGGGDIDIGGDPGSGEPGGGSLLSRLAEHAGLFTVGFGDNVSELREQQPPGDLGPEFRLEWAVPNPEGTTDTIVQRLYPYADAGAVTHTEADQAYMGMETFGGWYVGGTELSAALTEAGVPEQPPATGLNVMPIAIGIGTLCVLALLALGVGRTVRRRQHAVAT